MNRIIQFAVNKDDGIVVSRVGSEIAWPVLLFEELGKDGDFTQPCEYALEKMPVTSLVGSIWRGLRWTKKIPTELKNRHREFWGFKPLKRQEAGRSDQLSP